MTKPAQLQAVLLVASDALPEAQAADALARLDPKLGIQPMHGGRPAAIVFGGGALPALREQGRKVQRALGQSLRSGIPWIGIGDPLAPGRSLQASYLEAKRAIELGHLAWDAPRVILFEDALAYAAVDGDAALRLRLARVLDPIAKNPMLLVTLEAFISVGLSSEAAAKKLGVHRHTVDYRLRRLEPILGRSIRDAGDRLLLELAVVARRLDRRRASR